MDQYRTQYGPEWAVSIGQVAETIAQRLSDEGKLNEARGFATTARLLQALGNRYLGQVTLGHIAARLVEIGCTNGFTPAEAAKLILAELKG